MIASSAGSRAGDHAVALQSVRHIRLTLDPELVFERLILAQVARRSRTRAQHWLRAVLVQGFLTEGRWLQSASAPEHTPMGASAPSVTRPTAYGEWCAGIAPRGMTVAERAVHCTPEFVGPGVGGCADAAHSRPGANGSDKPFASLRRVIG